MGVVIRVAKLLPALTNSQGDAENAEAIVATLGWLGRSAGIVSCDVGSHLSPCDVFVLGHVTESDFAAARDQVALWADALLASVSKGSIILAVGSGIELLVSIGLLNGVVRPHQSRSVTDCVVDAEGNELWGFENSACGYLRSDLERPLGVVLAGIGNGDGTEGVRSEFGQGLVLATHLHGPVLVRNEELMDEIVSRATHVSEVTVNTATGQRARSLARENRAAMIALTKRS